jgi:cell division septation protein DedD
MAKSLMADDRYPRGQRPGENFRREAPPADQKGDPLSELARLIGSSDPFGDPPRPKVAPPAPRIADPSTWHDEPRRDEPRRDEPRREAARHDEHDDYDYDPAPPPREARFRIEDDYEAPHPPRHVPDFDDDGGEPEALDTWRPNDPYQHTDGMFPREPQTFAEPQPAPPPLRYDAAQPAPGYTARTYEPPTGYEVRPEPRWVPPRPTGGAPVFDPDDPLGYERDARAAVPPPARARPDEAPRVTAPMPPWPGAAPDARALHPDAYLRQRADDGPAAPGYPAGLRGGGDGAERFGDRRTDAADAGDDMGDDRYSAEDLAAHYATKAARRPPPPKRPRAVLIAAAAVGLAVIGAAGAFGYRLMSSGGSDKPAPVIRADGTPNKVVPAGAGDSGKQIHDRLAGNAGEKIVSREEQPVEIRDASRPPTPRMVFPSQASGAAPSATAAVPAPAPSSFAPAATTTGGEAPKRIRTVTVRSDQGTATPSAPRPSAAPILPPAAARADANAPLPINPAAAPAASANTRTAAVAPAVPALASAASSGGYVVQLSAQKTEAEAQASFRTMQGRYPTHLGGRAPIIRRKDTASGTMYGAQVGPFASREDAVQLCEGLKSAGGSCFVQRN